MNICMRRSALIIGLISSVALAAPSSKPKKAEPTLRGVIAKLLPARLAELAPGKADKAQVRKRLGSPATTETKDTVWFYDLTGIRYDTTFVFREGKLTALYHKIRGAETPRLEDLKAWIPAASLDAAHKKHQEDSKSGDSNRVLSMSIDIPQEKVRLEFSTVGDQRLRSVVLR